MHQKASLPISKIIPVLLCNIFEYYDIAIYTALAPIIAVIFFPSQSTLTSSLMTWGVFALRFLSRPLGGTLFGYLADTSGRKKALYITCATMGLATLCLCILPTYQYIGIWAPVFFILCQMIQSSSFAGEMATMITYIMEVTEPKYHVKAGMLISISSMMGFLMATCLVIGLKHILSDVQMIAWGWRIPFILGLMNIGIAFFYRIRLKETPFFVQTSQASQATLSSLDWKTVLQHIVIVAPVTFLFYHYSTSGNYLIHQSHQALSVYFPLINIMILMLFVWFTGAVLSRYMSGKQLMLSGSVLFVVLVIPVNLWLEHAKTLADLFAAKCLMAGILALLLTSYKQVVFALSYRVPCRTLTLGVSLNIAASVFGGTAPVVALWLSQYSPLAIGFYSVMIGLLSVAGLSISKNKPVTTTT